MSKSCASGKIRRQQSRSSSRRRDGSRGEGEWRSANDWTQNARRGSRDIDHLNLDHLCKFCSRGRAFRLSSTVSRSGCIDWRTHACWQARPRTAGWRGAKQRCNQGLWIDRQPCPINLGPARSPQTTSERTPSSAMIVVRHRVWLSQSPTPGSALEANRAFVVFR
jgi:hypothetical protein